MIECGGGFGFAHEPLQTLRILREARRQQLDRNSPLKLRITCEVNFTHSTCAQPRQDFIVAELLSFKRLFLISSYLSDFCFHSRSSQKVAGFFVCLQQRLDISAQRAVASASLLKKGLTLLWLNLQRRIIKLFDALPAFRTHPSLPCSARGRAMPSPVSIRVQQFAAQSSTPRLSPLCSVHRRIVPLQF